MAFNLYVSANMLLCAVLFAPWALPRETVSGILGRWLVTDPGRKGRIARVLAAAVDTVYFWEPNHCVEVYRVEKSAREILYP
ncbi:MAG: hypothetical protein AB7E55_31085 [Pigmentiphaga sp.]